MKSIILFTSLIIFCSNAFSQLKSKYTYLIVNLVYKYDRENDKGYFIIEADTGNSNAKEVYNLKPYKLDRKTINPGGIFFSKRTVSDTILYNYFLNGTEALMFLSENDWELIEVYNQITSASTMVSSYPVYYLRKEIH